MFCSNCGKSLKSEHTACPYCGMPVGESRFDSNRGYTGAQTKLRPGQAVRVNNSYGNHYSTAFNVESDKAKNVLPSDEDSSYRAARGAGITGYGDSDDREPLFDSERPWLDDEDEEQGAPPEQAASEKRSIRSIFLRKEEPEEEEEDEEADDNYDLTEEERNSISLSQEPESPGAGISEDVRRFMTGLREEYDRRTQEEERKAAKKKSKKEQNEKSDRDISYDAYNEDDEGKRKKKRGKKFEENFELDDEEEEIDFEPEAEEEAPKEPEKKEKTKKIGRKQLRVAKEFIKHSRDEEDFDDYDPDEDEDEPEETEEYDEDEYDDDDIDEELRRSNRLRVLRTILAAAAALLLIVGGIAIVRNISAARKNVAPVEDVSPDLWNEGTQLMQYRVSDDYIEEKLRMYDASNQSSSWTRFSAAFTADLDGLSSLLPPSDSRQLNDQLFVDALKAIQTNINNCLSNDWMAKMDSSKTETQKQNESQARWQVVRNQVTQLLNATSKGELDAVKKSEVVEYTVESKTDDVGATPTPIVYSSLQKGSSGDDVVRLQTRLTNLGYLNDTIDGKYGNKTVTAVQLFQQAVGLSSTGIADSETQTRLYADDAPMYSK